MAGSSDSDLGCGLGTGASSVGEIGQKAGKLKLQKKGSKGSNWNYTIHFFKDSKRPEREYTLTESKKGYPDVSIDPDLPMAPNCADAHPLCWVARIRGCKVQGHTRVYLVSEKAQIQLEEIDVPGIDDDPAGDPNDTRWWALPQHAFESLTKDGDFNGTRLAMLSDK